MTYQPDTYTPKPAPGFPYPRQSHNLKKLTDRGDITWIFQGPWAPIDNFFFCPIKYRGILWPTSEHAFAAMKSDDPEVWPRMAQIRDPGEAKAWGRSLRLRENWDEVKFGFMWEILEVKFLSRLSPRNRPPDFPLWTARERLRETGTKRIWEGNSWGDQIWGMTLEGDTFVGQNALGEMLMRIRESL